MTKIIDAVPSWLWLSLCLMCAGGWLDAHLRLGQATMRLDGYRATAAAASTRAREAQATAEITVEEKTHQLQEANHAAELRVKAILASHRAGTVRLSIPIASCVPPRPDAATAPASEQARAELDNATADGLIAIASDGDAAIRKLNACVDSYTAVRALINTPTTPTD